MSSDTCKLVHDLLRPEAYRRNATAIVKLLTTHASWVFLVGDDVWKVKRPVDFGFLDFRSVEARQRACEEEVRLNQRLAPEVYLGVEPVRETPAGYVIGGEGPIADWAVHMRRLPDEASAQALLARETLDARALEQIAGTLAEFFRGARPTPHFGLRSTLIANVEENFAQVHPFVDDLIDRETLEQVSAFQEDQLWRRRSRFMNRIAGERIREATATSGSTTFTCCPNPTAAGGCWSSTASSSTNGFAAPTSPRTSRSWRWSWRRRGALTWRRASWRASPRPATTSAFMR